MNIAVDLQISVSAVESASSRLRKRFVDTVRAEIAATLDEPTHERAEEEVRAVFEALA